MTNHAPSTASCTCGLVTCDEPWEPGCGLGTEEKYARVAEEPLGLERPLSAFELRDI